MDTNAPEQVAESPEARLEAIFSKGDNHEVVDEREEDVSSAPDDQAGDAYDVDESEAAEEGQAEPDSVELQIGDEVKELTKAELAEIVTKRDSFQRDYTQKTQEVALQRKTVEDRAQYLEARETILNAAFKEAAEVESLQGQLKQFQDLDWNSLISGDPQRALQLNLARQQLQENLSAKQAALTDAQSRAKAMADEHKRRQAEFGQAELKRRVGNLDDKTRADLMAAAQELAFSESDMYSPAALHALSLAAKYMALQKSKALTEKKVAQAKPMSSPAARSGTQSVEQSKREALKTRASKTGKAADAEAYLERLFSMKRKR